MKLSVIICTHNPREDYLRRTLKGLEQQTLPRDQWELLLIDNASDHRLKAKWNLSWHPGARHIREGELGLTPARLRGIKESKAEILVFVDDDNVLAENYLEKALEISREYPWLGVFGCSMAAEFETEPDETVRPYIGMLAVGEISEVSWIYDSKISPIHGSLIGAGMVIRKIVANCYSKKLAEKTVRNKLDRRGVNLLSGGDLDMVLCAYETALGVGKFPSLSLVHLIPSFRVKQDYILKLAESITYSSAIIRYVWFKKIPPSTPLPCRIDRWVTKYKELRSGKKKNDFDAKILRAKQKGAIKARKELFAYESGGK